MLESDDDTVCCTALNTELTHSVIPAMCDCVKCRLKL